MRGSKEDVQEAFPWKVQCRRACRRQNVLKGDQRVIGLVDSESSTLPPIPGRRGENPPTHLPIRPGVRGDFYKATKLLAELSDDGFASIAMFSRANGGREHLRRVVALGATRAAFFFATRTAYDGTEVATKRSLTRPTTWMLLEADGSRRVNGLRMPCYKSLGVGKTEGSMSVAEEQGSVVGTKHVVHNAIPREVQRFVAMGAGEQDSVIVWRLVACESRDALSL